MSVTKTFRHVGFGRRKFFRALPLRDDQVRIMLPWHSTSSIGIARMFLLYENGYHSHDFVYIIGHSSKTSHINHSKSENEGQKIQRDMDRSTQ